MSNETANGLTIEKIRSGKDGIGNNTGMFVTGDECYLHQEVIDSLLAKLTEREFEWDCDSGSEKCLLSEKSGYPCYRHIDHEYRKLFELNTNTTNQLSEAHEENKNLRRKNDNWLEMTEELNEKLSEAQEERKESESACADLMVECDKLKAELKLSGLANLASKCCALQGLLSRAKKLNTQEMDRSHRLAGELEKSESERGRLREALDVLCCDAHDLSDHEIDGGAPENRWEDMREALTVAESLLNRTP